MKSKEEEEDDAVYADVGIMFEGSHASTLKHFEWQRPSTATSLTPISDDKKAEDVPPAENQTVHVALKVVDDEPGAVQSGHYLWPASPALCEFLTLEVASSDYSPQAILELGAGTALVSLAAMQLFSRSLQCVAITDHDPGTLERARDNYETTLEELYERATTEEEQYQILNELGSIPMVFLDLEWGANPKPIQDVLSDQTNIEPLRYDFIVGSDLIYDIDVIRPLFTSVAQLLSDDRVAAFFLSQSFPYDDEAEAEIDRVCEQFEFDRVILKDELTQKGARIQEFRRKRGDRARLDSNTP